MNILCEQGKIHLCLWETRLLHVNLREHLLTNFLIYTHFSLAEIKNPSISLLGKYENFQPYIIKNPLNQIFYK